GGVWWLLAALPLSLLAEALVRAQNGGAPGAIDRLLLALAVTAAAWLSIFGLLGLSRSIAVRPRPTLRYLADASYWVYLIHLPIVAALQIAGSRLSAPPLLKCAAVSVLTAALCVWSYERWIRHARVGAWLDGHTALFPVASDNFVCGE